MALPPAVCTEWLALEDLPGYADDPVKAQHALDVATSWLFRSTCSQFTGTCTSTIRPPEFCGHQGRCGCSSSLHYGYRDDDYRRAREWVRLDLSTMVPGLIRDITAVVVNGDELPAADYRLSRGRFLVPHDPGGLWPWPIQNLNLPDDAEGTWSVTVEHGNPPPPELADAALALAGQLFAKLTDAECDLPDNATSVSKDGMTIQLMVPEKGMTGLTMVDSVVGMYPCHSARRIIDPAERIGDVTRVGGS